MSGAGISVGICELLCQNAKNGSRRNSIHLHTHFVILPDLISKGDLGAGIPDTKQVTVPSLHGVGGKGSVQ